MSKPPSILDRNFVYYDSASTDVTRTWARHGWKQPQQLAYQIERTDTVKPHAKAHSEERER